MKLLIYLAVWQRPEITEICFMGINRLKNAGVFPIEAFAVISEESMIPLCEKYGIKYCMHENLPVGRKKNYGLRESLKLEWDYLVEIGSDDVLYNSYLEVIKEHIGQWDLLTINNMIFLDSISGECLNYKTNQMSTQGRVIGMGRVISRKAIEKIGDLWSDKQNRGLDKESWFKIQFNGFRGKQIQTDFPLGIDIKSDVNIWPYNPELGVQLNIDDVLQELSIEEAQAIKSLVHAAVEV